jgi:outer membrane protein
MSRNALFVPILAAVLLAAATAASAQAPAAVKVAVIDVQRIVADSTAGKATVGELETFGKEQSGALQARREELSTLQRRISEGRLTLSEEALADLERQVEEKEIQLRRATDDAQREFQKRQEQALGRIEGRVMPIIQQIGEEGGYTMIFRKFESGLVYAAAGVDITDQVIARLDAEAPAGQ